MNYTREIPYDGTPSDAFTPLLQTLSANGFAVVEQEPKRMRFAGPGLNSTRQNPIRGVSELVAEVRDGTLALDAELGGVEFLGRFLRIFPVALGLFLLVVLGTSLGLVLGAQFGIGFGVPFAPGWMWLPFIGAITLLPTLPWLFLGPMITQSIRKKTERAVDALLTTVIASNENGIRPD
ncbi:MAG: hypothetical protein KDA80_13915 [Planctomycetaceae bacterium]|nr:hypothetical protein [Planctomycetaceae bacterium]